MMSQDRALLRTRVLAGHAAAVAGSQPSSPLPSPCVGVAAPAATESPLTAAWYQSGSPGSPESSAPVIVSKLQKDATYEQRRQAALKQLGKLQEALEWSRRGGGGKYVDLHRSRGKMLPRERIQRLVDPGTQFVELCPLAGLGRYDNQVPSGGVVTAIGVVHGRECVFICNDATVKGGAFFIEGGRKQDRAQSIAATNHLPCIYMVDGGGAKLDAKEGTSGKTTTSSDALPTVSFVMGGAAFKNQAVMSSRRIPQVALVCGMCTAGAAYIPAMCDESVIVRGNGTVYLGGPPLVKAATGEDADEQELGGAVMHTSVSGVVDHLAEDESSGIEKVRAILEHLAGRGHKLSLVGMATPEPPRYDPEELLGLMPEDPSEPFDMMEVVARIVDASRFHAFKPHYDQSLICGFAHIGGYPVGVVTNNGLLGRKSAIKAAHFVQICNQRYIPLVFLRGSEGFSSAKEQEQAGIVKDAGKMLAAIAGTSVPKFCVACGSAAGGGVLGIGGPAFDPRFYWLWPNAKVTLPAPGDPRVPAFVSTGLAMDDGVIDPRDTRRMIEIGISVALNAPKLDSSFGIFRM